VTAYFVLENQVHDVVRDIPTFKEAVEICQSAHALQPDRYHEVYQVLDEPFEGHKTLGVYQLKPGDSFPGLEQSRIKAASDKPDLAHPCFKCTVIWCNTVCCNKRFEYEYHSKNQQKSPK
jgi:hypothetical protein